MYNKFITRIYAQKHSMVMIMRWNYLGEWDDIFIFMLSIINRLFGTKIKKIKMKTLDTKIYYN